MNINVEYRNDSGFKNFYKRVTGKKVAVMFDVNTKPYATYLIKELNATAKCIVMVDYLDKELVPTEDKCEKAFCLAKDCDYLLAVGSGTLNELMKFTRQKTCLLTLMWFVTLPKL